MKSTILLLALLFAPVSARAQSSALVAVPNAQINWCAYPANAVPCTNYAPTYSSSTLLTQCPSNAPIVLQGSSTCQATADNFGNLGVWTSPGTYSYTMTVGGQSYGPFAVSVGGVDLSSTQTIPGNKTFTGLDSFTKNTIFTGGITGSLNGAINPQDYGAKCDGSTADDTAFQNATAAAIAGDFTLVIPATGNPCILAHWNLTNWNNRLHIQGLASNQGFQSWIRCLESSSDTAICIDLSGSQYVNIENVRFSGGTSTGNAPRAVVLMAKTTGGNGNSGNSQLLYWSNVSVDTFGDFDIYNNGGEVWTCLYCSFGQDGSGGVNLIRLTSTNSLGISSPFATFPAEPVSLSKINCIDCTYSAGGTSNAVAFESSGAFVLSAIKLSGFANFTGQVSTQYLFSDIGSAQIHDLKLVDLRVEPACTNCGLYTSPNVNQKVVIDAEWAAGSPPSVALVNVSNQLNAAYINLQPGDGQPNYPTTAVVCGSAAGTLIQDFIKFGGGDVANTCPGAFEFGVGGFFINGATGGDMGPGTLNLSAAYYLNGAQVGTIASGTATMTTAAISAGNCGSTVTVSATGVTTSDSIAWSFHAAPAGSNAGLVSWPTANNVNFAYCPNSAETPAAATINWAVRR